MTAPRDSTLKWLRNLMITCVVALGLTVSSARAAVPVAALNPNVLGAFAGIVDRSPLANSSLGGKVAMNFTSTGAYTGSFSLAGLTVPFAGTITVVLSDGSISGTAAPTGTLALLGLSVDFVAHAADGTLTGTIHVAGGKVATFKAVRNRWKGGIAQSSGYAGVYNAALKLPGSLATNNAYPLGTGYFISTIDKDGAVSSVARLADGTAVTAASLLGPDRSVPLHWLLYSATGSAQGWQKITDDATYGKLMDGSVSWLKAAQSLTSLSRLYSAGFPLHDLTTVGSKLIVPAAGKIELGLPNKAHNAVIKFSQGGIGASHSIVMQISLANTAVLPSGSGLTMTIDKTHGKFSGSFSALGFSAPYYGIFVPRLAAGLGQFQLPLPFPFSLLSGNVQLAAAN